jgi:hypothetical protein
MSVVFRPGDWQSTMWVVDPGSRSLHVVLHDFEGDALTIATLGYFFPSQEPVFGPATVRCLRGAQAIGARVNEPPPLEVLHTPGELLDGQVAWAPQGGIARYLALASHPEVIGRDHLIALLGHEKGRLARAFDALRAVAARRGVVAALKAEQITIDCPPETSYREADAHWRWLRDEGSALAGFTRSEFQEYVCIMQVIDVLPSLAA